MKYKGSCIYIIRNLVNGKRYIGSTSSFNNRKAVHNLLLRKNKHFNKHLQSAYNKYGYDSFKFFILEKCSKEILQNKEQYYIDNFKPEYNKRIIADSSRGLKYGPQSIEHKLKTSRKLRKFSDELVKEIRNLANSGVTYKEIGERLNINHNSLSKLVNGRTYVDLHKGNIKPINKNIRSKLTKEKIVEIYYKALNKENQYKLAEEYNVTQGTISRIKNAKRDYSWLIVEL